MRYLTLAGALVIAEVVTWRSRPTRRSRWCWRSPLRSGTRNAPPDGFAPSWLLAPQTTADDFPAHRSGEWPRTAVTHDDGKGAEERPRARPDCFRDVRHAGGVEDPVERSADGAGPGVDRDVPIERLVLDEHSWVDVGRGWLAGADELYDHLREHVAWQTSRLFRYDHEVEERRLGAGWRRGQPLPHPALAEAVRALQHRYRVTFDGFGMILYRDGRDGQAFHRDTDMRWRDDTIIAVLSLGARRPWLLRPRTARFDHSPGRGATHDLAPGPGDLLVMGGRAQADWEHSVAYQPGRAVAPRISIQWRHARRTGRPFQGSSYRAPRTYGRR